MAGPNKTLEEAARAVKERMAKEGQNTQIRTFEDRLKKQEGSRQDIENKVGEVEQMVIQLKVETDERIEGMEASIEDIGKTMDTFIRGLASLVAPKVEVVSRTPLTNEEVLP